MITKVLNVIATVVVFYGIYLAFESASAESFLLGLILMAVGYLIALFSYGIKKNFGNLLFITPKKYEDLHSSLGYEYAKIGEGLRNGHYSLFTRIKKVGFIYVKYGYEFIEYDGNFGEIK